MEQITLSKSLRIPGTKIILEKGDVIRHGKLEEAFRHQSAESVVTKMCNVIGRRIGKNIKPIFPGYVTKNKDGEFATYTCIFVGDASKCFAINFKMSGSSDEIYSIGICNDVTRFYVQNTEIKLNGFNIVQVIDQIGDILSGDENSYFESVQLKSLDGHKFVPVKEKVTLTEIATAWLKENPQFIPSIENNTFDYDGNAKAFNDFSHMKYHFTRIVKPAALRNYCRFALTENPKLGNAKNIPGVSVSSAPAPVSVGAPITTAYDSLIDEIFNMDADSKWKTYEDFVSLVATGKRNALIAYGMPGTGKTYNAKRVLIEHGIPFDDSNGGNVISGTIPELPALMTFLYRNKDEQVVVFDDVDNLLAKGSDVRANICKKIFDSPEIRHVGLNKPIKDKESDVLVPSIFDFRARVIMLSNKQLDFFDPAVVSRSLTVELNFTIEEMLELIKKKLEFLGEDSWELTIQDKMEVYDFYKEIIGRIKQVSLRTFVFALQGKSIANNLGQDWKKFCLLMMKDFLVRG